MTFSSIPDNNSAAEVILAEESSPKEKPASMELFELFSAILLGLGALLASVAGYQSGLWSGKSAELFVQASQETTKSADMGTFADSKIASDGVVKIQAIQLLSKLERLPEGEERNYLLHLASEIYLRELSDEAYDSLGLPLEPRKKYDADGTITELSEKELLAAEKQDFSKDYYSWMYQEKVKKTAEAESLFKQAQEAGNQGDAFSLTVVYYTMALFFAGLGLVFKSRMRWGFMAIGALVMLGGLYHMFKLPWA